MKSIIIKIFPDKLYQFLKTVILPIKYRRIRKPIPYLINQISQKDKIKVLFFPIDVSMWKYDGLFNLMLKHSRFEPYIVPFIYPTDPAEIRNKKYNEMISYFRDKKQYPLIESYEPENNKWIDVISSQPDLVFYTQPYNKGHKFYSIERLGKKALLLYTPYAFWIESEEWGYNAFLHNVAWKLFYPTKIHLENAHKLSYIKGNNVVITGYPLADDFFSNHNPLNEWKIKDSHLKRIIWAPHHSILETDLLNYSTFLEIADRMLEIAEKYKDKIQIAFKPHPRLKGKLYLSSVWGKDRTDHYYNAWENLSNGFLAEGDYIDLFLTSDAMIHDCSSFTVEYLYTGKPVMYITKEDHLEYLCPFGKMAYEQHYLGRNICDIEDFINNIVLLDNDCMKEKRKHFFSEYLKPIEDKTVAENMFEDICSSLK